MCVCVCVCVHIYLIFMIGSESKKTGKAQLDTVLMNSRDRMTLF